MIIERTEIEVIIRIPANIDTSDIQEMIDFVRYKEITSKSKAKPQEITNFLKTYKTFLRGTESTKGSSTKLNPVVYGDSLNNHGA